jgi:rsbT co-antagonist protein RsbR
MPASHPSDPATAPQHSEADAALPMSQAALDALPFPLSLFTHEGLVVAANELSEQLFRVPTSSVLGQFNILEADSILDDQGRALFLAAVAGQRGQAPPSYYSFSFPGTQCAERTGCWIETSYIPFRNGAGCVTHVGVMTHDVTDRFEAEQRLRTYEALIENAAIGMALTDPQGTFTYANAHLRELFGYGAAMVGMPIPQLLMPEDLEVFAPNMAELFANGRMSVEVRFICRDGSTRPISVAALLIPGADGAPLATAAVVRDLTEDHAREREQRRREEELRTFKAMVENAPDAIGIADLNGVYRYTNPAYQAMLGYDHDLVGMNGFGFIAAEDLPQVTAALANLSEQCVGHFQARYQRKDGSTFPASATVFLQEAPNGAQQLIGFVRDISEQQRAEQERTALQEQVITAQQVAIRELSTPLIPIAQGVVAMPLIGTIDTNRARLVIETLLSGVSELRAHTTILDITGVPIVDTQVANALLQAARAVKLLGARVILTGIRPEVAQTLVGLGVDLSGIVTRGTLQSGIADALERVLSPAQSN